MSIIHKLPRRRGFTLLELMVTLGLIAILAALVTLNLTESRRAARDANRQATVTQYATSLEQYYAQNRTYMLQPAGCTIGNTSQDYPDASGDFKLPIGPQDSCVGFMGGAWGSMNRRHSNDIPEYRPNSISDALRATGFLQRISTDPRLAGESPTRPASYFKTGGGNLADFDDYILTLCTSEGKPAQNVKEATEFGLYTQLERDPATGADAAHQATSKEQCGGPSTGYGWDTIQ